MDIPRSVGYIGQLGHQQHEWLMVIFAFEKIVRASSPSYSPNRIDLLGLPLWIFSQRSRWLCIQFAFWSGFQLIFSQQFANENCIWWGNSICSIYLLARRQFIDRMAQFYICVCEWVHHNAALFALPIEYLYLYKHWVNDIALMYAQNCP